MTDTVKIQVDLNNGSVNIEATANSLDKVFNKLESFLPSLIATKNKFNNVADIEVKKTIEPSSIDCVEINKNNPIQPEPKPKKSSSSKLESFKTVELGLDKTQLQNFKDFYIEKSPQGQSDQILAVIYWLIKNTEKNIITKDEIFTGLRTVKEKVPKRISSVLSNLNLNSYITKDSANAGITHIGEDYIERELPKTQKK